MWVKGIKFIEGGAGLRALDLDSATAFHECESDRFRFSRAPICAPVLKEASQSRGSGNPSTRLSEPPWEKKLTKHMAGGLGVWSLGFRAQELGFRV